ncbi:GIY-YIG nuclease family protein [Acrocarpospora sp. B8E8]|uniref:GIY-YIG nuclease family protein n=1 Tax=Acrocarpospora sp. B8E8 TaxID=3153572 RepID=UPI00325C509E
MSESSRKATLAKASSPNFELLDWVSPKGVGPVGLPKRHEYYRYVGHVYVIQLSNGTIKIGMTANPCQRVEQHLKQAGPFELRIVRLWLSIAHRNPVQVEKLLLGFARENSKGQILDEYFKGLNCDAMVEFARGVQFAPIDPEEIAAVLKAERERIPIFGHVNYDPPTSPPVDPVADLPEHARTVISQLFGRNADGSYGFKPPAEMEASVETAEAAWDVACEIADARGCCLECVLQRTPLDFLKETLLAIVEAEASRLAQHVHEHGQHGWVTPFGEAIKRALPADDPRFSSVADPSADEWDWDPEMGFRRWTKQGDLAEVVADFPPCLPDALPHRS